MLRNVSTQNDTHSGWFFLVAFSRYILSIRIYRECAEPYRRIIFIHAIILVFSRLLLLWLVPFFGQTIGTDTKKHWSRKQTKERREKKTFKRNIIFGFFLFVQEGKPVDEIIKQARFFVRWPHKWTPHSLWLLFGIYAQMDCIKYQSVSWFLEHIHTIFAHGHNMHRSFHHKMQYALVRYQTGFYFWLYCDFRVLDMIVVVALVNSRFFGFFVFIRL